jgi:phosphate transport system protein
VVLEFFRGGSRGLMDEVQETLVQMLRDGNDVFNTSLDALFGGGRSKATKREVKSTDRGINAMQAEVRRALVTHAAVNPADLPLVLQYASIVKDAERVGDYAKNLYDLVLYGASFDGAPDEDQLDGYRVAVSTLILEAADVFAAYDAERARALIGKADTFLDDYDDRVREQFSFEGDTADAVARALYYRFLQRTTAHVMNVLTALVQPLDRLDYYDEVKDDRLPE